MEIELSPRRIGGSTVTPIENGWRLSMPGGDHHNYRLAQLDDYVEMGRRNFKHAIPWELRLRARASAADIPGTWGFGLWNDPFGLSLGFGGKKWRLPALPQVTWFMHASRPNWLSFRDGPLTGSGRVVPANGFFAGTFRSPRLPSLLFTPGVVVAPLLALRPTSRLLRRVASRMIRQDGVSIEADVTAWHEFSIRWLDDKCAFAIDGSEILNTPLCPRPPLGLVIWIDNQFAAWTPEGRIGYGILENTPAWMEIEEVRISTSNSTQTE